jgi:hypothetical protein
MVVYLINRSVIMFKIRWEMYHYKEVKIKKEEIVAIQHIRIWVLINDDCFLWYFKFKNLEIHYIYIAFILKFYKITNFLITLFWNILVHQNVIPFYCIYFYVISIILFQYLSISYFFVLTLFITILIILYFL